MCSAHAAHIFGGDFYYTHLTGNNYKITLKLYADCGSKSNLAYPYLTSGSPVVLSKKNSVVIDSFNLNYVGTFAEISPICPTQINNTTCNGGTLPGVEVYEYTTTRTLNSTGNWEFLFKGDISVGTSQAGRSTNLNNIVNPSGSSILTLSATLNNSFINSNPTLNTLATPYFCSGIAQKFNPAALDADGDSLYYQLVDGLDITSATGLVSYGGTYSAQQPLNTFTNSFNFSSTTGQLNFTPAGVQQNIVVYKISEYRNGVLIGSFMREMTFVVLSNCNNTPPTSGSGISNNNLGTVTNGSNINVCKGSGILQFNLSALDPEGNNVGVTTNGLPIGSIANVTNNNSPNPSLNFSWDLNNVLPGNYVFFVTYKDDGCPLSIQQTVAYNINVYNPPTITATSLGISYCNPLQGYSFNINSLETGPFWVVIKNSTTNIIVDSFITNTLSFNDSLANGSYTASTGIVGTTCTGVTTFTVNTSFNIPSLSTISNLYYCVNEVSVPLIANNVIAGAIVTYVLPNNTFTTTPPIPNTSNVGIFTYKMYQSINSCISDTSFVTVEVLTNPVASIAGPTSICTGDTFMVSYNGSTFNNFFTWDWSNLTILENLSNQSYNLTANSPGVYNVHLSLSNPGCNSDTAILIISTKTKPSSAFTFKDGCFGDSIILQKSASSLGIIYNWNITTPTYVNNTLSNNSILVYWGSAGSYPVSLTANSGSCTSSTKDTVIIQSAPIVDVKDLKIEYCLGDTIQLLGNGALNYKLITPQIYTRTENDIIYGYPIQQAGNFVVLGTSNIGCKGYDSVQITKVTDCCWFSFPNAFTPGNDVKNESFKAISVGNFLYYDLRIFNRWGNTVFSSDNPKKAWTGIFDNKALPSDTYFYLLKAKCFNGKEVAEKGEVLLIR
jgi:gliding motility-associated-like protein